MDYKLAKFIRDIGQQYTDQAMQALAEDLENMPAEGWDRLKSLALEDFPHLSGGMQLQSFGINPPNHNLEAFIIQQKTAGMMTPEVIRTRVFEELFKGEQPPEEILELFPRSRELVEAHPAILFDYMRMSDMPEFAESYAQDVQRLQEEERVDDKGVIHHDFGTIWARHYLPDSVGGRYPLDEGARTEGMAEVLQDIWNSPDSADRREFEGHLPSFTQGVRNMLEALTGQDYSASNLGLEYEHVQDPNECRVINPMQTICPEDKGRQR